MRKAVVREADGFVENVIEIKPQSQWPIPEGCRLVIAKKSGSPGDTWDGQTFVRPEREPVDPTLEDRIKALEATNEVARESL